MREEEEEYEEKERIAQLKQVWLPFRIQCLWHDLCVLRFADLLQLLIEGRYNHVWIRES